MRLPTFKGARLITVTNKYENKNDPQGYNEITIPDNIRVLGKATIFENGIILPEKYEMKEQLSRYSDGTTITSSKYFQAAHNHNVRENGTNYGLELLKKIFVGRPIYGDVTLEKKIPDGARNANDSFHLGNWKKDTDNKGFSSFALKFFEQAKEIPSLTFDAATELAQQLFESSKKEKRSAQP